MLLMWIMALKYKYKIPISVVKSEGANAVDHIQ